MADKLNLDYSHHRDGQLDETAELAEKAMKGNARFDPMADKVIAMATARMAYHEALMNAKRGGIDAHAQKDEKRALLELALRDLAFNCNMTYAGDRAALESTTLPLSQSNGQRRPKEPVTLTVGHRSITVTLKKDPDADTWLLRYTEAPVTENSVWTELFINRSPVTINNLTTDKRYAVALAPIYHLEVPEFGEPLISKAVD